MSSEYKLDFCYLYNDNKFHLKDCCEFRLGWSRHYNLMNSIYYTYADNRYNELSCLVELKDLNARYGQINNEALAITLKMIELGGYNKYEEADHGQRFWDARTYYTVLMTEAIKRTPEHQNAVKTFQNWLQLRPGVKSAWKDYTHKVNARNPGFKYPSELTLELLGENVSNTSFRKILDHNRPDKYVAGNIVALSSKYINKRGKDPFYHKYEPEIRKAERVGTVLKKENATSSGNYGIGSREIRVLWFATGEETKVEEKCLKKYNPVQ